MGLFVAFIWRQDESKQRTTAPLRIHGKQYVNSTAQRLLAASKRHPQPAASSKGDDGGKPSGHGSKTKAKPKDKGKASPKAKGKRPAAQDKTVKKKAKKAHNDTKYGAAKKEFAKWCP